MCSSLVCPVSDSAPWIWFTISFSRLGKFSFFNYYLFKYFLNLLTRNFWCTPFPIWNQFVVLCLVLIVASWPAYRFLRRQVRCSSIPISWRIFQFVVIHTVKGFGIVKKTEVDVFLELACFFDDLTEVVNLISGSSAFSKSSLNIWNFTVHVLLKPGLENFDHYFASVWDACNCVVVWAFFDITFLWDWNENRSFPVLWPLLSFPNLEGVMMKIKLQACQSTSSSSGWWDRVVSLAFQSSISFFFFPEQYFLKILDPWWLKGSKSIFYLMSGMPHSPTCSVTHSFSKHVLRGVGFERKPCEDRGAGLTHLTRWEALARLATAWSWPCSSRPHTKGTEACGQMLGPRSPLPLVCSLSCAQRCTVQMFCNTGLQHPGHLSLLSGHSRRPCPRPPLIVCVCCQPAGLLPDPRVQKGTFVHSDCALPLWGPGATLCR